MGSHRRARHLGIGHRPTRRQPGAGQQAGARLFGDVNDPSSEVSKAIRERGGYELMPEWDTRPANRYLPRLVREAEKF